MYMTLIMRQGWEREEGRGTYRGQIRPCATDQLICEEPIASLSLSVTPLWFVILPLRASLARRIHPIPLLSCSIPFLPSFVARCHRKHCILPKEVSTPFRMVAFACLLSLYKSSEGCWTTCCSAKRVLGEIHIDGCLEKKVFCPVV